MHLYCRFVNSFTFAHARQLADNQHIPQVRVHPEEHPNIRKLLSGSELAGMGGDALVFAGGEEHATGRKDEQENQSDGAGAGEVFAQLV